MERRKVGGGWVRGWLLFALDKPLFIIHYLIEMREVLQMQPSPVAAATPHIAKTKWRKKFQQRANQRREQHEPQPLIIDHYEMAKGWCGDRGVTTTSSLDCFDFSSYEE